MKGVRFVWTEFKWLCINSSARLLWASWDSIKGGEFRDQTSDYQLLKKDPAPQSRYSYPPEYDDIGAFNSLLYRQLSFSSRSFPVTKDDPLNSVSPVLTHFGRNIYPCGQISVHTPPKTTGFICDVKIFCKRRRQSVQVY
jgi:hypothetical protein